MTHPPSGPSTPPPPSGPRAADAITAPDLLAEADRILRDLPKIPARQYLSSAAAVAGGPVQPPAGTGEEPMPGSADAMATASSESRSAVVAAAAGTSHRAGGPPVPGAGFTLPRPPEFQIGIWPPLRLT